MGMSITSEQNEAAASAFLEQAEERFGGSGVTVSIEHHSNAVKFAFVRMRFFSRVKRLHEGSS